MISRTACVQGVSGRAPLSSGVVPSIFRHSITAVATAVCGAAVRVRAAVPVLLRRRVQQRGLVRLLVPPCALAVAAAVSVFGSRFGPNQKLLVGGHLPLCELLASAAARVALVRVVTRRVAGWRSLRGPADGRCGAADASSNSYEIIDY